MALKAPVTIDALMAEWMADARIKVEAAYEEMAKVPILHAKYLNVCTYHSIMAKRVAIEYRKQRHIMSEYYDGSLNNPEDLEKHGLEPNQRRYLKNQIPDLLDSDDALNTILMKKLVHEEIVDFCKAVLKELNNRVWELKHIIEWEKVKIP